MAMTYDEFVKNTKARALISISCTAYSVLTWRTSTTKMLSNAVCSQVCMLDKSTKISTSRRSRAILPELKTRRHSFRKG